MVIFGIALALLFAFMSGCRDGGNIIAANVLSKSITPQKALHLACVGELFGPFLLGSAVAFTLGKQVFDVVSLKGPDALLCLCAALASATTWSHLTWWAGSPAGATHTLLGALLGGFVAAFGLSGVNSSAALIKIFLVLLIVPIAGFVLSSFVMSLTNRSIPASVEGYRKAHWLMLFLVSAGHGANNAQKATALITMTLLASGYATSFEIPLWSVFCTAVALSFGLSLGAWKIVKLLGKKTSRITPPQSFVSHGSTGMLVITATLVGSPISANQILKSSLLGVTPREGQRSPGRIVLKDILTVWLINFPAAGVTAAALYWIAAGALGYGMGSFGTIMEFLGQ
ncbi:MAG: anion permease [Deltaproteobacteria bacterium]|nr:anion permease [Deltaproteobacteria bacterium]